MKKYFKSVLLFMGIVFLSSISIQEYNTSSEDILPPLNEEEPEI